MRITNFLFSLFLILFINVSAKAQNDKLNLKGKYSVILGGNLSGITNLQSYNLDFIPEIKLGYHFTNQLFAFIGYNSNTHADNLKLSPKLESFKSFTVGGRVYFLKNQRIFLETGLQSGIYKAISSQTRRFNQLGFGFGLNFNLRQNIGFERSSIEILLRVNPISNLKGTNNSNSLSMLGSLAAWKFSFPYYEMPKLLLDSNTSNGALQSKWSLNLAIWNPEIHYETVLSTQSTLDFQFKNDYFLTLFGGEMYFKPSLAIEPRYYYNFIHRKNRGQKVKNNAADFISLVGEYEFILQDSIHALPWQAKIIANWGLHRSLGRHFDVEFKLGLGYFYTFEKNTGIEPSSELKFYYVF